MIMIGYDIATGNGSIISQCVWPFILTLFFWTVYKYMLTYKGKDSWTEVNNKYNKCTYIVWLH